jgi:hypothetical protein
MFDDSKFLTPEDMLKLAESKEGRDIIFSYIMSARIARSVNMIFDMLQIVPEPVLQTKICQEIYDNLFRVPVDQIFEYIDAMKEIMDDRPEDFMGRTIANC